MAKFSLSERAFTAEKIEKDYESEKHLFVDNATETLEGTSSSTPEVSYDERTKLLHVGTTTDYSVMEGLKRKSEEAGGVYTSLSSDNSVLIKGN